MRKTVLVLTAIERAFYSATIEYQLIEPIIKIAKRKEDTRFVFLALVPFTFYFIRGEKRSSFGLFRKRRLKMRKMLKEKGILIFYIPVLYPLKHRSFYLRWFEIPLFLMMNLPVLFLFQIILHATIIHTRGYPASLLAYAAKKLNREKFIFDMRDVYTLKGIEAGFYRRDGCSFKTWRFLEQKMIAAADAVVVTSKPFKYYVEQRQGRNSRIWLVPNSVNRDRFFANQDIRDIVRKGLGIDKRFVLLHSGTFSTEGDIALAIRYFKKWKLHKEDCFFLILTPNKWNADRISEACNGHQLSQDDFRILTPEPEEVPDLLRAGDVGLHLEGKALATEYCIAIKDGEYLATGLPVICTPYLKGIAPLIEQYDCGMVIDSEQDVSFEKEKIFLRDYKRLKQNTRNIVDEVLSLDITAETLEECYRSLLDSN
jgi:glycosyltransferase involved in cell wall biosynthesis